MADIHAGCVLSFGHHRVLVLGWFCGHDSDHSYQATHRLRMKRIIRLSVFALLELAIAFRSAHTSWGGDSVHTVLGSGAVALAGGGNGHTSWGTGTVRTTRDRGSILEI